MGEHSLRSRSTATHSKLSSLVGCDNIHNLPPLFFEKMTFKWLWYILIVSFER